MSCIKEPKGYIKMSLNSGDAYIKESRLKDINKIDAVIFDCDGVLIDVRESYDKAIAKATAWIFERLTGYKIPEDLITSEIIFLFRKSGGFNNDYDIVYGLLMFLLSEMPPKFLEELTTIIRSLNSKSGVSERIQAVAGKVYVKDVNIDNLYTKLEKLTSMLDHTGVASIDRIILSSKGISEETYNTLKNFLYGSRRVDKGIITAVFEEIFCGSDLFKKIHNIEPEIFHERGTIENSRVIVRYETLNKLSSLISGPRFGIASGSRFAAIKYILGGLLDLFNTRALIFLDNIEEVEREYLSRGFIKISLIKPNPYSLLRSAWSLEPFRMALYVGDSIEDALTTDRANRIDPRFMFSGVYAYTGAEDKALREFLKFGCDIISPSVNEIPLIIETTRRRYFERGGAL
ncbi:MAG: hypothetical protein QXT26_06490 [Thermoproteota archaeon]